MLWLKQQNIFTNFRLDSKGQESRGKAQDDAARRAEVALTQVTLPSPGEAVPETAVQTHPHQLAAPKGTHSENGESMGS